MALHPDFPRSPYATLPPDLRWFPAAEELRSTAYEKLLPPLVANVREAVKAWRDDGYAGATSTSRALLTWWFETDHLIEQADGTQNQFRYYFAQREAVETVIWLYDVRGARDKFDLLRFDASGAVSANMFDEDWPRFVVKMATGAGKTKVLSLLMAWSYFHKLYEPESSLVRNFLVIAPNIIVLDRLRADFDGLRIFFNDPVLPDNGHAGHNWRDDFQVVLHIQDDVRIVRPTGNIFLTNIHRVYLGEVPEPSLDDDDLRDYFLAPFGDKPVGKTTDSQIDLGEVVREIDELAVFNDEAHHIHDNRLAWFQCIQDIHHRLLQKDQRLALQMDVTATPRHDNGAIFVQTVSDYPLVEAIAKNVVKHPVLPDAASRAKLTEHKSPLVTEKYADYLYLGIEEWRKSYVEHEKLGKKAVLFVMVDDTKNCDEVGSYLEKICPELQGAVLVIHTKNNGEISEASSGKGKEELELLRRQSNEIDTWESPYKAIVSVLMLKEGWDVRNVTVIVGLYMSPPEHALVLCCDEKSQVQALDRTQPGLPMKPGRAATMTHDYKRNGTTTLFAAMNTLDGTVISRCEQRHRHIEWLDFLRQINRETAQGKTLHLICDNYATHKHPKVKEWIARHPRFHVHFTPTSASWLNMVERFFRDITTNRLRNGVFRSVPELTTAIKEYIGVHNKNPKPFVWTAKAQDILAKVIRANRNLSSKQNEALH